MRDRCLNEQHHAYEDYGGRGITICEKWGTFEAFYEDMGERPSRLHSIDRINNNLGYCKENCRWATRKEQCNNKRSNVMLTLNGRTQSMAEWAQEMGVGKTTLSYRKRMGWTDEMVLTTPIEPRTRRTKP